MEILVVGLGRAEAGGVAETQIYILRRIVADVGAGRHYHIVDERVFVEASSDEKSPAVGAPLVLQIARIDVHGLCHIVVVAQSHVVQIIVVIFQPRSEFGRHKYQIAEGVNILCAGHHHYVLGLTIGVYVHATAVIAVAIGVLHRGKSIETVHVVFVPKVERKVGGMNIVVGLFGYVRKVRLQINLVATAAIFVCAVIFE